MDATPSLLRKTSGINLYPEADEETGVELYYFSGWNPPYIHFRCGDGLWTKVPGLAMEHPTDASKIPRVDDAATDELVWYVRIPTLESVEMVPNNKGTQWDKAPGNANYVLEGPGRYILRHGKVDALVEPPGAPALLRADEVGSSDIKLVWNPPIFLPSVVTGYKLYRDGELIATVEGDLNEYRDHSLMGLRQYSYYVCGVNKLQQEGPPSETCLVRTGEPGKPSAPRNLSCSSHTSAAICISWSSPVDHGGAPIKYYRVYRNGEPVAVVPAVTDVALRWTDESVVSGEEYSYAVAACHHRPRQRQIGDTSPARYADDAFLLRADSRGYEGGAHPVASAAHKDDSFEGVLSDPIEVKAVQMLELPRLHDNKPHIILQTFNWRSCDNRDGWHNVLLSKVKKMVDSSITMAWLAPPSESVSEQGYMPTKWYNLTSAYGTTDELLSLNTSLRENGISPMLDLVVNHRCGTKQDSRGQWTIFEDPPWENWAIVSNNLQGYLGAGAADSGEQSECAPDIDHTNAKVREDVKAWTTWLFKEIGFAAVRIDMAPGYNVKQQVEYVKHLGSPFAVGEYWNGNAAVLQNYVGGGSNVIACYDFALYYNLRRCVETGNFEGLVDHGKLNGFVGRDPQKAVTFIDNHDTEHLDFVGKFAGGNCEAVLRGYAFLLTHPGTPCIYWNHWSDYGDNAHNKIKELCNIRQQQGIHSGSGVHVARCENGLYAAFISRDRHCGSGGGCVAIKIGWNDWHPGGGDWKVATCGDQYCIWKK